MFYIVLVTGNGDSPLFSIESGAQLFESAFFDTGNIRARYSHTLCYLALRKRLADAAVYIGNAVAFADYFALAVGEFLGDKAVEFFGVDFQLHVVFNVYAAVEDIR